MNNSKQLVSSLFPKNVSIDSDNDLIIGDLKITNIVALLLLAVISH